VLFQKQRALVFNDMRQFGAVRFAQGPQPPAWWSQLPVSVTSREFTRTKMDDFLKRHGRLPIKAALLLQSGFPGIGNWMADEILWCGRINPHVRAGQLSPPFSKALWQSLRFVSREAVRRIGHDYSDPPKNWFFHQRWSRDGVCPRDGQRLVRETIGGRTTAWCPKCQT
jgi:formamidopyrimidine-DNA glycosylase